jgi:hypothetical protein
MSYLTELDEQMAALRQRYPDWHIWYVPGLNRTVTWCAQPWPLINVDSPEHLAEAIEKAGVTRASTAE